MHTNRRRLARALAVITLVAALSACTPEDLIRFSFHDQGPAVEQQAVDVAWCESRDDPSAVNGTHVGLFQLDWRYHSHYLWPGASLYDPLTNAGVAKQLYIDSGGWGPWACRP